LIFKKRKKTYILPLLLLENLERGYKLAIFAKQLLLGFESCKCNHLPRKQRRNLHRLAIINGSSALGLLLISSVNG